MNNKYYIGVYYSSYYQHNKTIYGNLYNEDNSLKAFITTDINQIKKHNFFTTGGWLDIVIELSKQQAIEIHLVSDRNIIAKYIQHKTPPWDRLKVVAHNQGENYEFETDQLYQ